MFNYISDLFLFIIIAMLVIVIAGGFTLYHRGMSLGMFLESEEGKGAAASAALAIVSIVVISLIIFLMPGNANADHILKLEKPEKERKLFFVPDDATFFNDAGVYLGLDYTKKKSPQCELGGIDEHGTSNLGVWVNLVRMNQDRVSIDLKYTHHSCFIGADDKTYDGLGISIEWKLYERDQ